MKYFGTVLSFDEARGLGFIKPETASGHIGFERDGIVWDGQADSARAFDSMREAEAFIRSNTPVPAPRTTLYDRDAGDA